MFFVKPDDNSSLVFIRSNYVKAFPCSRRRSTLIDGDGDTNSVHDKYYIPFDPEARLNTESNNRKHSALNGFKNSYLYDWTTDKDSGTGNLTIVLAGYLFEIQLPESYSTPDAFGNGFCNLFTKSNNISSIYANIGIEDVRFFSGAAGVPEAITEVLRDQTSNSAPTGSLDFLAPGEPVEIADSYYFSGVSFSTTQLNDTRAYSIRLLQKDKNSDVWQVCETARLPEIEHGTEPESVKVGILEASSIKIAGAHPSTLNLVETDGKYQLQFTTK